jgi:hypothetical protein
MRLFLSLSILIAICSCKSDLKPSRPVIIGFCCGECSGKCFRGYLISDTAVYEVEGTYCDNIDTSTKQRVNKTIENKVREIFGVLPPGYAKYQDTIGCPDCHDQCAVFISTGGIPGHRAIIDPDNSKHPKELDEFVRRIWELKLL